MTREGLTDYPIQKVLTDRWSPYAFSDKPVSETDVRSLFEAARWAPSSFNEQPWRYLVALKSDRDQFDKLLSVLVEKNQEWAKRAPVLALGLVKKTFTKNGKPNRVAHHDLGLASANLTVEATARGLTVHQMAGILPDKAREIFDIPDDFEAWTGIAVGYLTDSDAPEELLERDRKTPTRKPQSEWVFQGRFGEAW